MTIDQQPIGRVPRSNAATYSDALTPIREAFAASAHARERGLTPRHFSFNVPGGRCERCLGAGVLTVQMHFLPDVQVRCPTCRGRRSTGRTLYLLDEPTTGLHAADTTRLLECSSASSTPATPS